MISVKSVVDRIILRMFFCSKRFCVIFLRLLFHRFGLVVLDNAVCKFKEASASPSNVVLLMVFLMGDDGVGVVVPMLR